MAEITPPPSFFKDSLPRLSPSANLGLGVCEFASVNELQRIVIMVSKFV